MRWDSKGCAIVLLIVTLAVCYALYVGHSRGEIYPPPEIQRLLGTE